MKYISEFRERRVASALAAIAQEVDPKRDYHIMEFCGGHTHAIFRYGVQDLLPANVRMLVRQLNQGRAGVENQFTRGVTYEGNLKAQALVAEVFELRRAFEWRGLGVVPYSGLRIKQKYAAYDAEVRSPLAQKPVAENKACECGAILWGVKKPIDCKIFGTVCTPHNSIGSCMVSSEGACAAYYKYRRHGGFHDAAEPDEESLEPDTATGG